MTWKKLLLLVLVLIVMFVALVIVIPPQVADRREKKAMAMKETEAKAEAKAAEAAVANATAEELINLICRGKPHASKLAWEKIKETVATKELIHIVAKTKNQIICQEAWQILISRGQKNLFFTEWYGRKWGAWMYIAASAIDQDISLAAWTKAKETKQINKTGGLTEVLGASHSTVRAEASELWETANLNWKEWDKSDLERIYWDAKNAPLGSKIEKEFKRRQIVEKAMH